MSARFFAYEHGDPGRRSRCSANPRRYATFERLVLPPELVQHWPIRPTAPASHFVTDPSGQRTVIVFDRAVVILEPYGAQLLVGPTFGRWATLASTAGLYYGPRLHSWSGSTQRRISTQALLMDDEPRTQVAIAETAEGWLSAVSSRPEWTSPDLRIEARNPIDDEPERMKTAWRAVLHTEGLAAVDDDGRVGLLNRDGLHVYEATPAARKASPQFVRTVAPAPYSVSCGAPGWLVLSARDHGPTFPAERPRRTLLRPGRPLRQRWHTHVQAWKPDGTDAWQLTVPFDVYQPPIERPDGSLVVAGRGLAGISPNGTIAWQRDFDEPCAATAFGDGSLAIAQGSTLRILDPSNVSAQRLDVPHGEAIVTQPMIAPDGTIYVSTPTRLYVVR